MSSALCVASRWLSAGALGLTLCALALLAIRANAGSFAQSALALVIALGGVQTYLAVRIEFDRAIFEVAAERADGFAGFDEALHALGWKRGSAEGRTPQARAAGLRSLVTWSGGRLGVQFALMLAALFFPA